jgi:ribonuclease HI
MNAPSPRHEADLDQILANAHALLDDEVRADPARWQPLIHPDFFQFGFGGSEVHFDDLHTHLKPLRGSLAVDVLSAEMLADDVALVLWRGTNDRGTVNRASVWVRTPQGWKLRYQQGTQVV